MLKNVTVMYHSHGRMRGAAVEHNGRVTTGRKGAERRFLTHKEARWRKFFKD